MLFPIQMQLIHELFAIESGKRAIVDDYKQLTGKLFDPSVSRINSKVINGLTCRSTLRYNNFLTFFAFVNDKSIILF
jgi:hypothetical protein